MATTIVIPVPPTPVPAPAPDPYQWYATNGAGVVGWYDRPVVVLATADESG